MDERTLLRIKTTLGQIGLLNIGESLVRTVTPSGKRIRAHQQAMLQLYGQFIQPGSLCFDIGANMGSRTEIFLRLRAKVVSVEPQTACMNYLRLKYGGNSHVTLVQKGLDAQDGERELLFNAQDSPTASMSKERISSVKDSRHLDNYQWDSSERVSVTTLDKLITTYGKPDFCKIDVEGFEYQVLKGLTQPIKALSFEFVPDFLQPALDSLSYLATLGAYEFNYSPGETMQLALPGWADPAQMRETLLGLRQGGDVYARYSVSQN